MTTRPLLEVFPRLRLPFCELGDWPTPVQSLQPVLDACALPGEAWVKRDDLSSPVYGGNKVRTLEVLFAEALEEGATHIYSTGAFGTNHGAAAVLHAPRVGLVPGLVLFPQPRSEAAITNFEVLMQVPAERRLLLHWSQLPLGMAATHVRHRVRSLVGQTERPFVMVPGGATPRGALAYVSAAFELAAQVKAGLLPEPAAIHLAVGSTCTSAGLLVGLAIAQRLGLGLRSVPKVVSVRVTPWPVTSVYRIVSLAERTSALLAERSGDPRALLTRTELRQGLQVDGRELGFGYGKPTRAGEEAIDLFARVPGLKLDTSYSGKAAASLLRAMRQGERGPRLFWSTKSTAPLPPAPPPQTPALARWWAGGRE